ncbi:MAG: hypothetical protein ABS95_01250 [Verrucomicrobia bacterium SCN 57-15]|nr:MAG: hypothetical protein ABS95_01250 [Verrucomicrobia bacterium SCN 57-15]
MKTTTFLATAMAILLITGCATHKKLTPNYKPLEPLVQVIPPQGKEEPRVAENPDKPEPIYFNPVIEEVEMSPYINDEGNLVFPGKVLVIRQPGHWNLTAAQKNRQYFVPAENQPPQLAPPSKSYYDYIQSKKNGLPDTTLDVSRVRVLGYTQREDRQEAESKLLPGETAAFDPYLGWLAIPETPGADRQVSGANQSVATSASAFQPPAVSPPPALKQPVLSEPLTNAPPVDAITNTTESPAEQQKKLRSILEDAFKKAEQAREPK